MVNDDFGNTSALLIAIESDSRSYSELHEYSDEIADQLRRIPSVAAVKSFGDRPEQIIVVLGMVVDNSIVVIDGYLEYLGKGYEPHKAAIDSARQYFMPMLLVTPHWV